MFGNKHLHISGMHISKSKMCYYKISSVHYFYVKTELIADFQICISVPLTGKHYHNCRNDKIQLLLKSVIAFTNMK